MRYLCNRRTPATFSELSRWLDLPDVILTRLLQHVIQMGWVEKTSPPGYIVGAAWKELAGITQKKKGLRTSVQPVLDQITEETGLPSALSVYSGAKITFIATTRVEGQTTYRSPGSVNPHIYKNGFAMTHLPFEPDLIQNLENFDEAQSYTLYTRKELKRVLNEIRRDKFFFSRESTRNRLTLPLFTNGGRTCSAVVGVTGSPELLHDHTYREYLHVLRGFQPDLLQHL